MVVHIRAELLQALSYLSCAWKSLHLSSKLSAPPAEIDRVIPGARIRAGPNVRLPRDLYRALHGFLERGFFFIIPRCPVKRNGSVAERDELRKRFFIDSH